MDVVGDVFAGVAAAAAVAAAVVAIVAAVSASRAGRRADAAAVRSAEQAERAIAESGRTASAAEGIAAGVERLRQRPEPWVVRPIAGELRELVNAGGRRVVTNRVEWVDESGSPAGRAIGTWIPGVELEWPRNRGERFEIDSDGSLTTAASVWIRVYWREIDADPGDEPAVWQVALR